MKLIATNFIDTTKILFFPIIFTGAQLVNLNDFSIKGMNIGYTKDKIALWIFRLLQRSYHCTNLPHITLLKTLLMNCRILFGLCPTNRCFLSFRLLALHISWTEFCADHLLLSMADCRWIKQWHRSIDNRLLGSCLLNACLHITAGNGQGQANGYFYDRTSALFFRIFKYEIVTLCLLLHVF